MQLTQGKFDVKQIKQFLVNENKFITDLLARTCIPERTDFEDYEKDEKSQITFNPNLKKTSRAKSLIELQQRLEAIKSKKKLNYKEKLTKKGLKNRMKKKNSQNERNAQAKLKRAAKLTAKTEVKTEEVDSKEEPKKPDHEKPVFNKEDKIVYSKFDFETLGKPKKTKQENDPKKLLKQLKEKEEKLQKLKESGEIEKAVEIKEKTLWKNALAKAEGQKVKDDPTLLKKSVKKQEQRQRSSKKKWENRIQGVEKAKDERQKKRTENIQKRKKEKKTKQLKSASKRGKIIPGY